MSLFSVSLATDEVLYWMLTDDATVDGNSVFLYLSPQACDDDNWNAARVVVSGGNFAEPIYLDIHMGEGWTESGEFGVEIGDSGSGFWGSGVPTGNQSPLGKELLEECLFVMEIGHNSYDEISDLVNWTTLAVSDSFEKTVLEQYIYHRFDINPPETGIWTPMVFHEVPEPNTFFLFVFGMNSLVLKRKWKSNLK